MWKNWHSNNFEKQKVEKLMSQIRYILAAIDAVIISTSINSAATFGRDLQNVNTLKKSKKYAYYTYHYHLEIYISRIPLTPT